MGEYISIKRTIYRGRIQQCRWCGNTHHGQRSRALYYYNDRGPFCNRRCYENFYELRHDPTIYVHSYKEG